MVLDTNNFSAEIGIAKEMDYIERDRLMKKLTIESTDELSNNLRDTRYNISYWRDLSVFEKLKIDYKLFQTNRGSIGFSSVYCSISLLSAE